MNSIPRLCSIKNCHVIVKSKDLCIMHYTRLLRRGSPHIVLRSLRKRELHGDSLSPTYHAYKNMISRIYYKKDASWENYNNKGIFICKGLYDSYSLFKDVLGERPIGDYSLDRINNEGNYTCGKCAECTINKQKLNIRWATKTIQSWNRSKMSNNTSGYIGVIKSRRINNPWKAVIWIVLDGKKKSFHTLGCFKTPEEAAIEYDKAVIFFRGEYGVTNIL